MTADNVLFEIKGLKKNFGDLEVLKGIHTTIRKGEVVVVIGPSGSGKSTFIRCLNLLETPTEGQIFFEGSCITDKGYAVHKHREKVGMVFQQFNLFNNLTILDTYALYGMFVTSAGPVEGNWSVTFPLENTAGN